MLTAALLAGLFFGDKEETMILKTLCRATAALSLFAFAGTLAAHHSSAGYFDVQNTVTTEGVITKVMWANPHSSMFLDVKNSKGESETWILYGFAPNVLTHLGYSRDTFPEGLHVAAIGNPARDSTGLSMRDIGSTHTKRRRPT